MAITLNFKLTEAAQKATPSGPSQSFPIEVGDPLPDTGDIIDVELADGPRAFVVVGRVFIYRQAACALNVYLDLPPDEQQRGTSPEIWAKLGE